MASPSGMDESSGGARLLCGVGALGNAPGPIAIVRGGQRRYLGNQRMSGLGAWQMAWGKLLGGTVFVWYCAAFALLVPGLRRA